MPSSTWYVTLAITLDDRHVQPPIMPPPHEWDWPMMVHAEDVKVVAHAGPVPTEGE